MLECLLRLGLGWEVVVIIWGSLNGSCKIDVGWVVFGCGGFGI